MGKLRILSHSAETFRDRTEAALLLADELNEYAGKKAVVLGIPRGGVMIAAQLAKKLGAECDIVLSRKLGAPGNPELAIGAVAEDGKLFLHDMILSRKWEGSPYIKEEKTRQMAQIERRIKAYREFCPKIPLAGRIVIVTDDGLATGATMQAALWSVRQEKPKKLVAAVPVAPEDTAEILAGDADELVILRVPELFGAVGQFYKHFDQVDDEEVVSVLRDSVI